MKESYLKQLGNRLLHCRSQKDLSRKDLATLVGIPTATVLKMEQGEEEVGIEPIIKVCNALHCSADYLLTGELGFSEWAALNRKMMNLPEQSDENMRKILRALWESSPKSVQRL